MTSGMSAGTLAFAALLLALPMLPGAGAQAATGASLVLEDPVGDVKTELGGLPAAGGEAAYPGVDLVGLTVREMESFVAFTVHVAALQKQGDAGADGVLYLVHFAHNGREFRLAAQMAFRGLNDNAFTSLSYRDTPQDEWSTTWSGYSAINAAANTLTAEIDRNLLADKDGAAPFPGRLIDGIHVLAQSLLTDGSLVFIDDGSLVPLPHRVTDALPDAAPYPSLAIRFGVAQTGHARLTSELPFRASNGEATTFAYAVHAHNVGDRADTFELMAVGVPAGYTLVLPIPTIALEGGTNTSVPVLLTMPFGHQHGALASFVLEMHSLSDASSVGRLAMGVRFLAVPQPAGHHDTLYLHKANGDVLAGSLFNGAYMNTLEDDPNDAKADLYSSGLSGFGADQRYWWSVALSPALEMGLDLDPSRQGRITLPIGTTTPLLQATVSAALYVRFGDPADGGHDIVLATLQRTPPVDLAPDSRILVEGPLVPVEDAPRLAFQPGSNLRLFVDLLGKGIPSLNLAEEGAFIAPGASLQVPLHEWHDPVDEILAALGGPALRPLGPQERLVNPGEAAVFQVSVTNPTDKTVTVALEVSGQNAAWASLPSARLAVPAHDTAKASVVVRAPVGAVQGERADLVLQAYPRDDPTARGLLRLVAIVDTDADHPDDTAVADDLAKQESPGANLAVSLGAVALLALAFRRRR